MSENYTIDINTVIKDIQTLSNEIRIEISDMETFLSKIKSEWCGPASDAFQRQIQLLLSDLNSTARKMDNISQGITMEVNKQY